MCRLQNPLRETPAGRSSAQVCEQLVQGGLIEAFHDERVGDRFLEQPGDDVLVPGFQLIGAIGHDDQESGGPPGALLGGAGDDMADDLPSAGVGPVEILQDQCGRLVRRGTEQAARDAHVEL